MAAAADVQARAPLVACYLFGERLGGGAHAPENTPTQEVQPTENTPTHAAEPVEEREEEMQVNDSMEEDRMDVISLMTLQLKRKSWM